MQEIMLTVYARLRKLKESDMRLEEFSIWSIQMYIGIPSTLTNQTANFLMSLVNFGGLGSIGRLSRATRLSSMAVQFLGA